jgi:hypothetical protein
MGSEVATSHPAQKWLLSTPIRTVSRQWSIPESSHYVFEVLRGRAATDRVEMCAELYSAGGKGWTTSVKDIDPCCETRQQGTFGRYNLREHLSNLQM